MIRRRRFLGAASIGLASAWAARPMVGQEVKTGGGLKADPRIDRILTRARGDGSKIPGMIGAIIRGEKVEAIGSAGIRKVGAPELIGVGDLVHLGSCTKAMTATMIGTLVDEGKLRWDVTLAESFPADASVMHADFRGVTLLQLLHHRAGLPANGPWGRLGQGRSPTEQRRELLRRMAAQAPKSKPGSAYEYSNVGYALAGLIAERATGSPWEELMRRRVFGPLGMASAGFGPPGSEDKVDQPWGHQIEGGRLVPEFGDNPSSLGPAGTVHCSVGDWAKFASAQFKGTLGKARLVSPETLRVLHTPPKGGDYACGWIVVERPWGGGTVFNHGGSNTLWFANIWIAPARNLAFIAVANSGDEVAIKACDDAIGAMIGLVPPGRRG